jgi:hypothetical protein
MDLLGKKSNIPILDALREGRNLKVTVDNIDGRMYANQVTI